VILLASTTDKLQLITSTTCTLDVHCSYIDLDGTSFTVDGAGRQNTAIVTGATTDVLAAPAAATYRNLKQMTARNKGAGAVDVTVQFNQNATLYELHKVTLNPGETLIYVEGKPFDILTSLSANRLLTYVESDFNQRIFRSVLTTRPVVTAGTEDFITISGTAYYVYVGRTVQAITAAYVQFHVTTAGAGAQTAEVGLFSTPNPPNKVGQTLTKLAATGTLGSLTATGMVRNTSSLAQVVPAGTHLWAAIRTAMATTQPKTWGLSGDYSEGHLLTTTGGGALTGLTTAAGALIAITVGVVAPDIHVTLD
jgi:hypothetical protein